MKRLIIARDLSKNEEIYRHVFKIIKKSSIINDVYKLIKDNLNNYVINQNTFYHPDSIIPNYYNVNNNVKNILQQKLSNIIQKFNLTEKYQKLLYRDTWNIICDKYSKNIVNIINKKFTVYNYNLSNNKFVINKREYDKISLSLYKEIKQYIRTNIKEFSNIKDSIDLATFNFNSIDDSIDIDLFAIIENKQWNTLSSFIPYEQSLILGKVFHQYNLKLLTYINKLLNKDSNTLESLFSKLDEYVNKNLRKIFLTFRLEKDKKNHMYYHS